MVARVLEPPVAWPKAHAWHLQSEIVAHPDGREPEMAGSCLERALALAGPRGMRPLVACCRPGLGRFHRRAGQGERAGDHLAAATSMHRGMARGYRLGQAEAEMAKRA